MKTDEVVARPITLANYVASFLPDCGGSADLAAATAAQQLCRSAEHFGSQACGFLRGADATVNLFPSANVGHLIELASDAARVAWRFAADAETVIIWHNATTAGGVR